MADFLGHYNTSGSRTTVRLCFTTHDKDGGAVAPNSAFEAADIRIYKDGSATERASTSGYTMTSPFDSVTGLHHVSIDLTDNTTAGFYAAGSFYMIVLVPDETVDTETVVRVLAYFEIGPPQVNVTQFGGAAGTFSSGRPEVNASHIAGSAVSTSSAQIGVNVVNAGGTAWGSGAITAGSIASNAFTAAKFAAGAFDAVWSVTTRAITDKAGFALSAAGVQAIWDALTSALTTVGSIGKKLADWTIGTAQTGDAYARLGAPAGASVSADIAAVKSQTAAIETDTQDIQSRLPAALVSGRMDSSVGAMAANTVTASALAADAVTEMQSGLATQTSVDDIDTIVDAIKAKTDNLPSDPADASVVAGLIAAVETKVDIIDTGVDAIHATTDKLDDTLEDQGGGVYGFTEAALQEAPGGGGSAPTAAEIADAVWDEAIADHDDAGSTGEALAAAGSAGDPWTTALPGSYSAGQAGKIIGDNLNATVSSRLASSAISLSSGKVTVGTNDDKTGYGLADNAITSAKINDGAFTAAKFASGAFDAVWSVTSRTLSSFGSLVSDVATAVWAAGTRTLSAFGFSVTVGTNNDKTGYALTSGERTAIANEVEAQIIDETDSEKVLTAITDKIAAVNPDLSGLTAAAIASAVWANASRTLTALDEDNTTLDLDTTIRAALGMAAANLDTKFSDLNNVSQAQVQTAAAAALNAYDPPTRAEATADKDAVIAAMPDVSDLADVKAKTDLLDFTDGNVSANIKAVNGVEITGAGVEGSDEWRPA